MKKIIFVSILCLIISTINGQSWISSSRITSTINLFEISSVIDNGGNVYSFGHFEGILELPDGSTISSYGGRDYFLVKFLPEGNVDWVQHYGSTSNEYYTGGVDVDSNGDIYITGGFQGYLKYTESDSIQSTGTLDAFLIKVDNLGISTWARNIAQGDFLQYSTSLATDISGDIVIAGSFRDSITFNDSNTLYSVLFKFDAFYAKFSPANGDLIWAKQAKTLNGQQGYIWDIATSSDGYYLCGTLIDTLEVDTEPITSEYKNNNAFLFKTDLDGSYQWHRQISGHDLDYSYAVTIDDENSVYISSFFASDTLYIESTESNFIEVTENSGSYDIYFIKYNSSGDLQWYKIIGGKGNDRVFDLEFFDNKIYAAGFITDTVFWGGIPLVSSGTDDKDMFTGALEKDGNFREANTTSGYNKSTDESRAIFQNGDKLYTVMRTDSELFLLGDSIYTSDGEHYYLILGVIGCAPISIDNTIIQDIQACYGDSTGSIQILASGGFGAPWKYSIDNGLSYQDIAYFGDLPAGDYTIVVIDAENCAQPGDNIETISQPDTLMISSVTYKDIAPDSEGEIVVAVSGGSAPFTYTLQPSGVVQGFGTYTFAPGEEGSYVVEVNDAQNCGPVSTDTIEIIVLSDGVDLSELGVKLYPNPSSGVITLEMPFDGTECTLEVLSLTGQVMLSRQVYSNGMSINETIDLSDLSKGMYMIRVDGQTLKSGVVVN